MENNRLHLELERMRANNPASIIDLSDASFHGNGLRFSDEILESLIRDYLGHRDYRPDPKGGLAAREAIAAFYARHGAPISAQHIIITASTSESYSLIFSALADAGDNVVLPAPTYPLFEYLVEFARLEARYYATDFEDGFRIDARVVERQIDDRTRFIVLISPNNPTGHVATSGEIRELLDLCRRTGVMLITDEVFSEFVYDSASPHRLGELPRPAVAGGKLPIFTLNGVSKMFASPDLKLAWIAVCGDAVGEAVERLELANDTFLNCSSLSQHILAGLFERGGELQSSMFDRLAANRRLLLESLTAGMHSKSPGEREGRLGPLEGAHGMRIVSPQGGIHCVIGIPRAPGVDWSDDEDFAVYLLRQKGLYVHPGYFYGLEEREEEVYIVVSFLKEPRLLADGLARLTSFVQAVGDRAR